MFDISTELVRTDVTCIKLNNDEILAGIGDCLHIFNRLSRKLKKVIKIFNGQKIYGIIPNYTYTQYLVYGGEQIKICSSLFKETASQTCCDWILDAKWVDSDQNLVTIFMHNIIILWTNEFKLIKKVICEEKCILYSAYLTNNTWNDLIVLSGTVFSQILIWWPSRFEDKHLCPVLCKLNGHKGVIFSIHYNQKTGLICSTSDDRSAIIWSVASGDLLKELKHTEPKIFQKVLVFGHTARVFKCEVLNNNVLTAGEDSLINIWDFNGKLVRKIEAHQGASVWSFDCDENNNLIVSGGGDCGITVFSLNQDINKYEINMSENPKKIVILQNNNLVTISEKGLLEYYNNSKNENIEIARHDDLISYALLEISPCRCFIALAGYYGTIYIYKQADQILKLYCSHQLEERVRIFSFHWLSSSNYLVCGAEGIMSLWAFEENSASCRGIFKLPPSKERWTTAACMWKNKCVAVGDRKGNIYLYSLNSVDPIQVIKKAHNYLGVTKVYVIGNELISLGRNCNLKRYSFDETQEHLSLLSSNKLPFTWLAALCETDDTLLLLSFLGDEFVIWDYNKRRTLLQFHCGGGHRSWDFFKNNDDINFVYIKDKLVHSVRLNWNALYPRDVISGCHISEINGACCLNSLEDVNKFLFISGGEDTTLRIHAIESQNNFTNFKSINVLKSHLSSIRTLSVHQIKDVTDDECKETYLVFSAGGRAQIIIWTLQVDFSICDHTAIKCSETYSYYQQPKCEDSENRIMDLCTIIIKEHIILIAACSNGTLKVFLVLKSDETKNSYNKMLLIKNINYKLKCILKVSYLEICGYYIILSMATDGKILFWNFTDLLNNIFKSLDNNNQDLINDDLSTCNLVAFNSIDVHQSGINSFTYKVINNHQCMFLSGGDDNAIVANLIEFRKEKEALNIKVVSTFSDVSSHCAQITGASIFNDYFITTSIDQKLNIFKWSLENEKLNCVRIQTYNLVIADIHGMECFNKDDKIFVVVYGKGVEVCKIDMNVKSINDTN